MENFSGVSSWYHEDATLKLIDYREQLEHLSHFQSMLTAEEQRRAGAYRFEHLRQRYIIAHGWVRKCLAALADQPPQRIAVCYGPSGKLQILFPQQLYASISYSTHWIMCGVARQPLGVDIEVIDAKKVTKGLCKMIFSAEEAWRYAESAQSLEYFFTVWSKKEAYLKWTEQGISVPLPDIDTEASGFAAEPLIHPLLQENHIAAAIAM